MELNQYSQSENNWEIHNLLSSNIQMNTDAARLLSRVYDLPLQMDYREFWAAVYENT